MIKQTSIFKILYKKTLQLNTKIECIFNSANTFDRHLFVQLRVAFFYLFYLE